MVENFMNTQKNEEDKKDEKILLFTANDGYFVIGQDDKQKEEEE